MGEFLFSPILASYFKIVNKNILDFYLMYNQVPTMQKTCRQRLATLD
jgi:hypothetical protein